MKKAEPKIFERSRIQSSGVRVRKIFGDALVILIFLLFSLFLMFHTFSYNPTTHSMQIATTVWSDFAAHIPLIRSFSLGANLNRFLTGHMPEYPLYPGEPIRYHFLFYMLVGTIEKLGLPLDWALNIPSALGFTLLLWAIWSLAFKLFNDRRIATLSVIFFLFNGSLAFLKFFTRHPLSFNTPVDIIGVRSYPAFGPWDGGVVSAFWNLNIYTNQRHLAVALAIGILFMLWSVHHASTAWKRSLPVAVIWGFIIGTLPFFHQPMLLTIAIILTSYFIVFPNLRIPLITTGAISLVFIIPQLLLLPQAATSGISWYPGYLIHDDLGIMQFIWYWFANLGLHAILIPIGFLFIPAKAKRALIPLFFVFIAGNLFKFSIEVAANHKFFNFSLILGSMISAYVIIFLIRRIKPFIGRIGVLVGLVGLLTLSGVIDFFVIANDTKGAVADYPRDPRVRWIAEHTPPDAVFLNSSFIYHPASLAGKSIFLGWPYFTWSAGYTGNRFDEMKQMYEAKDPSVFCPMLQENNITFVTIENTKNDANLPVIDVPYFLDTYSPAYLSADRSYAIFTTNELCK